MLRVLGIGDNTVDIYLDEGMQYPGGNAVNVAVQAGRAGAEASYLGCLGNDALGALVLEALRAEGVDISHCRRREGPNPWSRIAHTGGDRKFMGSNPGVRARYELTAEDDRFIAARDLVHTSVHSDLDGEMARLRRHARRLSYDYSEHWRRPGVAETMRHVDIAFLSDPRAEDDACRELLAWCAGQGPSLVVLTRGVRGALAWQDGVVSVGGIAPATVVDTLGAGDAFIAGFLVAHGSGGDMAAALAAGARQAAQACAVKGGFGHGVPTRPGQPGLQ